jgi:membrane-bound lytic murein transglycosylase D
MKKILVLPLLAAALGGCASKSELTQRPHADAVDSTVVIPAATTLEGPNALLVDSVEDDHIPETLTTNDEADLWARIRDGFALDLDYDNPRIKVQRDWYARNQEYLDRVATRASRYLHYMVEEAEKREIPMEIVLLPIVESAFDPFAYSHGSASGPWQFISSTGRIFGLDQGYWYDGRRDIVESTHAAYDYLSSLQKKFDGDWLLALASYNCGSGNVSRAINRNRAADKPTDFWNLRLPRETRAYAPKLIAIAQIVQNPEKYGITLKHISDESYFEIVEVGSQIDLSQAAKLAEISIDELHLLNPGFNQWATAPNGPHRLLVPKEKAEGFRERLANTPSEQWVQWDRYTIRSGDSLIKIANKFNTTPEMLKSSNRLRSNNIIAGQTLLIPRASASEDQYVYSEEARLKAKQDRGVPGRERVDHVVRAGDTLWDLSQQYKVNVRDLAKWNNMAPRDALKIGQKLAVWTSVIVPAKPPQASSVNMIRKVRYAVRRGDSLSRIASKFRVSVNEINKWNRLDPKRYLQPGQRLTLYVDIRNVY